MILEKICRKDEIKNLYNICIRLYETTSNKEFDDDSFKNIISLNGGYGSGKTYFLNKFKEYVEQQGNPQIVKLNIWEDDFADDPLIPILHNILDNEIFEQVRYEISFLMPLLKLAGWTAKGILKFNGIDLSSEIDDVTGFFAEEEKVLEHISKLANEDKKENIIQKTSYYYEKLKETISNNNNVQSATQEQLKTIDPEFFIKKQVIKIIKKFIEKAVLKTQKPFIILVDELDRCRPDYAVTTLERIKHIFNIKGLIFILAVDRKQLEHSVRHAFGSEWDFDNYYLRFAPIEISLVKLSEKFPAKELLAQTLYDKLSNGIKEYCKIQDVSVIESKIQEIFVRICEEAYLGPRTLIQTIEKRVVLGLPPEYLIPMIFLSTNNPYRDAFYQFYINNNFKIDEKQKKIKDLFFKIMFPLNPIRNRYLDSRIIFDILNLFCFPNIIETSFDCRKNVRDNINSLENGLISKSKVNGYGSQVANFNYDSLEFIEGNIPIYFNTLNIIQQEHLDIFNTLCDLRTYQPILKSLFEHYKPIENV